MLEESVGSRVHENKQGCFFEIPWENVRWGWCASVGTNFGDNDLIYMLK